MSDILPDRPAWHESAYPVLPPEQVAKEPNFLVRGIGYLANLATDRLEFFTQLPTRNSTPAQVQAFEDQISNILDR